MSKYLVDIDDELLVAAERVADTAIVSETVNYALAELVRANLRRRHADQLATTKSLDPFGAAVEGHPDWL